MRLDRNINGNGRGKYALILMRNFPVANLDKEVVQDRANHIGRLWDDLGLRDLFAAFASGRIPTISLNRMNRERMEAGACRVCAM